MSNGPPADTPFKVGQNVLCRGHLPDSGKRTKDTEGTIIFWCDTWADIAKFKTQDPRATDYDRHVRKWYVKVTNPENNETRYECFRDTTLRSMQREDWIHPRLRNQKVEEKRGIHMDASSSE